MGLSLQSPAHVVQKVFVVGKLSCHRAPLAHEQRPLQGTLDLALPKSPEAVRNVAFLVKMVHIGDELEAVQGALSYFLTGRRKLLIRPSIRQPGIGGK